MYRTDLKVGQLSELARTSYEQPSRQLTVRRGKRTETKVLDAETATALEDWIAERRRIGIDTPPMFCSLLNKETRGGTLTTHNIRQILKIRKKRARLDRRVNPEAVRKSGRLYVGVPGSISAFELHPAIAQAAARLITDGHYDSAVQKGAIALLGVLREWSGLRKLDGDDLVGAALGGNNPPIVLADLSTREGRNSRPGGRRLRAVVWPRSATPLPTVKSSTRA